jgi:predicted solute-binding protein
VPRCLVENRIETASYSYALARAWVDVPDGFELRERVTAEDVREENGYALLGSIDAVLLADTHTVISDVGIVTLHLGATAMYSERRPDEVEQAEVALGDCSRTSEALARATVHHFFGIDVIDWARAGGRADVTIVDGAEAMRQPESGHLEDLVRAWYILTSQPFASHVFVAPNEAVTDAPDELRAVVGALRRSLEATEGRRREMRRNLVADFDLDRERLTRYVQEQRTRLTNSGRKSWLDLARRVAIAMNLPREAPPVISLGDTTDD